MISATARSVGATAFRDEAARGFRSCAACAQIALQPDPGDTGVLRAQHLDGGVGGNKAGGHFCEEAIFHRRAEDGNFAESGGLENVVAAGGDE